MFGFNAEFTRREGTDDLEFLVSISQSLLSFSSLDNF